MSYSSTSFTGATWTILGSIHGLGTADLTVTVYGPLSGNLRTRITPGTVTIDDVSFDVVVRFAVAQAGKVVIQR
jgi:hypothetical protein